MSLHEREDQFYHVHMKDTTNEESVKAAKPSYDIYFVHGFPRPLHITDRFEGSNEDYWAPAITDGNHIKPGITEGHGSEPICSSRETSRRK